MAVKKKAGRLSPNPMGDYDNTTVYRRLDWVYYGGTSYICKKNNTTGIAPSNSERWQKIIDAPLMPNYWQMTSQNGKGTFEQIGTTWIMTVPTMSQASDAATAYWGVKISVETNYTIKFGISGGTNNDSVYVNVSSTTGSYYQFSRFGNGLEEENVDLPRDAWVWMKFQHYSTNADACAFLILEPITIIDEHRISFEEATARQNISANDSLSTIFGKIKKYFADLKTVAFTGKYSDLEGIPNGTLTIQKNGKNVQTFSADQTNNVVANIIVPTTAKDINAVPSGNRIKVLSSVNQITSIGFWIIETIENNYANIIGIDNNVADFYAIVSDYNGNGIDSFNFGDLLLFSPRLQGYHYAVGVWQRNARARLVLTSDNILTTKEQINANTSLRNVAGAMAVKEMFSEINSNLYYKAGDTIKRMYHLWMNGVLTGANKEIWITIPLNKPILGTPKITLVPETFVVRQNGLYLKNIGSANDFIASGIKIEIRGFVNGTGVTFLFVDSTGFGGTNNDAVAICMAYNIAFT